MAADRTSFDAEIRRNERATWVLVVLVAAMLLGLTWFAGYFVGAPPTTTLVLGVLVTGAYVAATWAFSVDAILAAAGARPANPATRAEKLLLFRVEEMAVAAHLPMPRVYVQDSPDVNAFATGLTPEKSVVCITTGALERLDQEELEGVIAHEMSHILNRDVRVTTLTVAMVGAIAMIAEVLLRVTWMTRGGGNRKGVPAPVLVIGILLLVLAPLLSRLVYFMLSRRREFLADASGVRLTRNPEGLARALENIRDGPKAKPIGSRTVAGLYLWNPWKGLRRTSAWSTHPPIDERIRRVRAMGAPGTSSRAGT